MIDHLSGHPFVDADVFPGDKSGLVGAEKVFLNICFISFSRNPLGGKSKEIHLWPFQHPLLNFLLKIIEYYPNLAKALPSMHP